MNTDTQRILEFPDQEGSSNRPSSGPPQRKPKSLLPLRVVLSRIGTPPALPYGSDKAPIDSIEEACRFWRDIVAADPAFEPDKEHLVAILLNTKLRPKGYHVVSVGALNETLAAPRETYRTAIIAAAYAVVLMHNHPSGDPSPSQADHRITRQMKEAGQFLQIQLLDHVIMGEASHFSFREAGIL